MRSKDEIRLAVKAAIEEAKDEIIEIGRHIWQNPEPGYREAKTSAYLVDKLTKLGLRVKTGLALTGFRADIDTGRPGPTVAILGELDSLIIPSHPECDKETGAVHSCGHNASATALVGAAIGLLKGVEADELCGKIALIATPAEESIEMDYRKSLIDAGKLHCIAGKAELLYEGVFNDVDVSFMHHLGKKFGYNDHNGCVNKRIIFHGKSCHASSPQSGVNALNAATLAQNAIAFMREAYSNSDKIRIHGIISHGGDAVNVIPDKVTLEYMLRAPSVKDIVALNARFDRIVMHAAHAAECTATIETVNGFMPLFDDNELGALDREVAQFLVPGAAYDANSYFMSSCTDMGDVATVIPAIHGYVPGAGGTSHSDTYFIDDEYSAYIVNSEVNALLAVELLYGDAEKGRAIAAHKKNLMSIEEYIKLIDSLNQTIESTDVLRTRD